MTLSIIIPAYNSGKVISRAISSILAQTFQDYEILVMDGGSKDETIDQVNGFMDDRIKLFSEPDSGIYNAMNKGILKSHGEWLYFLGSDDWLVNEKVFENLFSLDIEPYDVVYGEVEASHIGPRYRGEWKPKDIRYNRCHQAIFYRRCIFDRFGLYDEKFKLWADFDLNLKWFGDKSTPSKYFNLTVAHYSDFGASSNTGDEVFLNEMYSRILMYARERLSLEQKIRYTIKSKFN